MRENCGVRARRVLFIRGQCTSASGAIPLGNEGDASLGKHSASSHGRPHGLPSYYTIRYVASFIHVTLDKHCREVVEKVYLPKDQCDTGIQRPPADLNYMLSKLAAARFSLKKNRFRLL